MKLTRQAEAVFRACFQFRQLPPPTRQQKDISLFYLVRLKLRVYFVLSTATIRIAKTAPQFTDSLYRRLRCNEWVDSLLNPPLIPQKGLFFLLASSEDHLPPSPHFRYANIGPPSSRVVFHPRPCNLGILLPLFSLWYRGLRLPKDSSPRQPPFPPRFPSERPCINTRFLFLTSDGSPFPCFSIAGRSQLISWV